MTGVIDWGDMTSAIRQSISRAVDAACRTRRRAAAHGSLRRRERRAVGARRGWAVLFGVTLLDTA
jgi:hypothetical protein